ncbi:MAG: alpha/beta hydrolase [Clostridia bacterium]|nr:alpha/beta hydrolase [Clostridia bacterium]
MLYHTKEGRLPLDGTHMDYVAFGTGKKALLLIPGLNLRGVKGAGLSLAWMYRAFTKEYRVYAFDRKDQIEAGCTIWDLAEDLAAAAKCLNIASADVIGISQGGMIAQALAIRHPQLVHKLILGVTAAHANETIQRVVGGWLQAAEKGDWPTINRESITLGYSEAYVRRYRLLLPLLERMVKPADSQRFIRLTQSILTFDARAELHQIMCPVLVLGGHKDQIVTGEASLAMAQTLGCEVFLYDQLGHAAYDEAKDFNQRMLAFLCQRG